MANHNNHNQDIPVKTFAILGLAVVIPVLLFLLIWAKVPDTMPPSRNVLFSSH